MLFTSSGSMHKPMLRACLDEFLASKATFACCFLHVQRVKSTVFTKQVPPSSRPKSSLPSLRSKCRLHHVQRVKSTVFTKQVPPSSRPKSQVYRLYEASANAAGHSVVAVSTFKKLWLLLSYCWCQTCHRLLLNTTNIYRSANLTLEEKGELLQEHAAHLSQVDAERQFYKRQVEESKECVRHKGLVTLQPTHRTLQCTTPLICVLLTQH